MAMSTVDLDPHAAPCEWTGRNGTRFVSTTKAGPGHLFAVVCTVREDGTRVPFDTVDLHAEESITLAFEAWRTARTGYARVAVAA